ncbi:hypothetical protein GCM10023339_46450 [Alloalcanivorax gelatiniphagus]
MRSTIISATALTVAALTLSYSPAVAGDTTIADARDIDHGVDLRSVTVKHNTDNIVVTTIHANLERSARSGSAGAVYLDTDRSAAGPEYVFVGGYFEGTDYQLLETQGFGAAKWADPVDGSYRLRLNYDRELVRMRISRETVGSPTEVRVAVRVSGTGIGGTTNGVVDWLGEPRSFSDWVAQ